MMKTLLAFLTLVLALLMPLAALADGVVVIKGDEPQELTADGAIKVQGDYIVDSPGARWFSDEQIAGEGTFGYLNTKEDGAAIYRWDFPVDTHTPITVRVNFTNMSKEKMNLLNRVSCRIVYADKYVFDTTSMQVNPNQITTTGETGYSSIEVVPLEPLVGTRVSFISNVPLIVRDTDASLIAYITIDDEATYSINLRDIIETL